MMDQRIQKEEKKNSTHKKLKPNKAGWRRIKQMYEEISFPHKLREFNFSADAMSKRAAQIQPGDSERYAGKPDFMICLQGQGLSYYRFH